MSFALNFADNFLWLVISLSLLTSRNPTSKGYVDGAVCLAPMLSIGKIQVYASTLLLILTISLYLSLYRGEQVLELSFGSCLYYSSIEFRLIRLLKQLRWRDVTKVSRVSRSAYSVKSVRENGIGVQQPSHISINNKNPPLYTHHLRITALTAVSVSQKNSLKTFILTTTLDPSLTSLLYRIPSTLFRLLRKWQILRFAKQGTRAESPSSFMPPREPEVWHIWDKPREWKILSSIISFLSATKSPGNHSILLSVSILQNRSTE
jgi:hypothetical protein